MQKIHFYAVTTNRLCISAPGHGSRLTIWRRTTSHSQNVHERAQISTQQNASKSDITGPIVDSIVRRSLGGHVLIRFDTYTAWCSAQDHVKHKNIHCHFSEDYNVAILWLVAPEDAPQMSPIILREYAEFKHITWHSSGHFGGGNITINISVKWKFQRKSAN